MMDIRDQLGALREGTLSRRAFNRSLVAVGLTTVSMPLIPLRAVAAPKDHATYFTWGGFDIPDYFEEYVAKRGELSNFAAYGTAEEAFNKLQSGFVADVAHPCLSDMLWDARYTGRHASLGAGGDVWWCAAIKAGVPFDQINTDAVFENISAVLREQRPLIRMCGDGRAVLSDGLLRGLPCASPQGAMADRDDPAVLDQRSAADLCVERGARLRGCFEHRADGSGPDGCGADHLSLQPDGGDAGSGGSPFPFRYRGYGRPFS